MSENALTPAGFPTARKGLRDEGILRSALERPVNKWQYEQADEQLDLLYKCALRTASGGDRLTKLTFFADTPREVVFAQGVQGPAKCAQDPARARE